MRYRDFGFRLDPIWAIIIINLVVFIASIIVGRGEILYYLGLQPLAFIERPWTIVTSMFTHIEIFHILFNMLTFYCFGTYLISLIGQPRFVLVYLLGGIAGGLVYMLLAPPSTVAIGASGAVFALGGALAVLRPSVKVFVFPIPVPIPLWIAVVGGFVLVAFQPYVAWQAHLGGVLFGAVAGYWYKRRGRYHY